MQNEQRNVNQNKMGVMPVPQLLLTMAIPLMLSLLVQSLYNIVDSIYVSRISEKALTATSLAYPVQILMIALGVGTAVGINALLSRLLGQKKHEEVSKGAATGLVLAALSSLLFILVGLFFSRAIAGVMTKDAETAAMCGDYLFIVTLLCTGSFLETMIQRFLQASGKTGLSMVSLIVGAGTNIILDPIFIFTLGMGVRGAAIATVIGQWLGAGTALFLNLTHNPEVRITFRGFCLEKKMVMAIYKVGFPTIIMQAMGSVMNFGMNAILGAGTAIAFFGAYFRLQSFLFMPMNGLGQACLPIIGYNFGAKNPERIRETVKTALKWGISLGLLFTGLFMILPGPLLGLFNASEDMLILGIPAIRIICVTFALTAVTMILGLCASGLGNGMINMIGTGIRQVVLLLPCFFALKQLFGFPWAWLAFWISEACAMAYVITGLKKELNKKLLSIEEK
ncbi:MAG: MATE family efflux transporter [Clostridia bacterium]|nr:MATE family efflux transporter [Clostridia bacterium]